MLHHLDNEGTARFITFSCYRGMPFLRDDRAKQIVVEEPAHARDKHRFRLLAYVIMPGHVHLVLHPPEGMRLGPVVGEIKSRSARRYFAETRPSKAGEKRVFWNRRCYDHNCRTTAATLEKINYCHQNPVKRDLASESGGWKWSSFGCYHGLENVRLRVDLVEL